MPRSDPPRGLDCLRTPDRLHAFEPVREDLGAVPRTLQGTLYRLGPGVFEDDRGPFGHWFDGEGLLTAVRFRAGEVSVACRLIEPAGFDQPDFSARGRLGRAPRGLARRLAAFGSADAYVNAANTALMAWRGRLFALFEAARPTEVDPDTLATLGATDLGAIRRTFGAHPHAHRPTGNLLNQGFVPPPRSAVDYYVLPPDGAPFHHARVPISGRFPPHDFALTDTHLITILSPVYLDVVGALVAGRPIAKALHWRPERGTEVVLTPLSGGPGTRLAGPPLLHSHTANAFEEDGTLVVQGIFAADMSLVDWLGRVRRGSASLAPAPSPGRLGELRIDVGNGTVRHVDLAGMPTEFPAIDPRWAGTRTGVVYGTGYGATATPYADFWSALVRFDLARDRVATLDFGPGHAVSEPVFLPDGPAEGEGWLLCINYDADADRSYVAIVRAGEEMDLVARVPLSQALPMSLHGLWVPNGGGAAPH